ncbi:hypothetical protein PSET11_01002 [Arthrobacter ulcerisalmonis]|uniref:Uncharacterized protein n=1 Tax=Arthrobacter ulcerisalmonis TaxID=2483813 RepID=A0A3P5WVN5_9MICC|nr:hypothetical protein PSET11_01002 [Arthrobacter ulcerisalmonis]
MVLRGRWVPSLLLSGLCLTICAAGVIDAGAHGTFVADCRITSTVRAAWLTERLSASQAATAAVAG